MYRKIKIKVPFSGNSKIRLDKALSILLPIYSRSLLKKWILNNQVQVDNVVCNKPAKIIVGKNIVVYEKIDQNKNEIPEDIPLNIIYEDEYLLVINKPSGLVVHPGAGNLTGTMLNGLLFKLKDNVKIPRSGIVHRLDKDTTGLIVVAKTVFSYFKLVHQLKIRKIIREYKTIVHGILNTNGTLCYPIKRHPIKRTQMAVNNEGKSAITHYKILKRFREHTYLKIRLETGRTHQIRVHMSYINHSIVGDPIYSNLNCLQKCSSRNKHIRIDNFHRQALHATMIRLVHPITNKLIEWKVSIPEDMKKLMQNLENQCI